ncbi:MAG: Mov34/MPN/PAD-1 family protein [Methanosarcinales archaeon Met12]|nr:MAG: Mov34/MPN/PAD-1 family protein [Methanosarcinales archaeon Met12]
MKIFQKRIKGIAKDTLQFILESCKSTHPNEFVGLLQAREDIITDVIILPGTISSEVSAVMMLYMMPLTLDSVGSVHSHPSSNIIPSTDDLVMFERGNNYNIIAGHPYTGQSWACYNSAGKRIELPVLDIEIEDDISILDED